MVKELVKKFDANPEEIETAVAQALQGRNGLQVEQAYDESVKNFEIDMIVKGRVLKVLNQEVVVDIGYKSEGAVPIQEFEDAAAIKVGDEFEVLLEALEDESGLLVLSKRKADRIRGWERVIAENKEGDVVKGTVIRKIKGGLLVDIGVPVFLPASQVSIRRAGDIGEFIGKEIECKIIKIDESRMNIVVSRRKLIEEKREKMRQELMTELEVGQIRKGVVKNIADFGAFVDLGGIDGLLHITDMSWGRVGHPSEVLSIDQEIDIKVLKFDKDRGRIALGLKQLLPSPWVGIDQKYPVGTKHKGTVVNIMPYGAFVKLEEGVEGLVHISEMSWTRRVNHPSEIVSLSDEVDVVVLDINTEKQEISLGMKQTEVNPWTLVEERYPAGTVIEGRVRNITNYGAFIEIEEGVDGLLHVSDMSWTKKVNHPSELMKKGDTVRAVVLSVDSEKKRVALGLKQLSQDPWLHDIPRRFSVGDCIEGHVTKITNFGVFVELESGLEGLLHISELGPRKVHNPEDVVKVADRITVRILKVDPEERKIGLSLISVEPRSPEPRSPEPGKEEPSRKRGAKEAGEPAKAAAPATEAAIEPASEAPESGAPLVTAAGTAEPSGSAEAPAGAGGEELTGGSESSG
ncbi:MAG: 30S ribosomal protein S1 [Planctomycetota bacterium]